ncbi:MAG TPA: phage tail tape measure protein [Phytomonospora sp.]
MALTVGELAATITVDDSEAEQGLDGFRQRLRSAMSRFTQTARDGGEDAGGALGEGLDDGASVGADTAGKSITGIFKGLGLAAVGGALGSALMAGITEAMNQEKITGRLAAQLGQTPEEARRYGHIAGKLYADAVTEDFQGAADVISAVMRAGIAPPDATNEQLQTIATHVSDLADTFELDLGQTANAVGQMIKTGLAKDGTQAVDALTRGLQKMGPRADDIADTFNEYSTIFRQMGLSAEDATGLLSQGMKAGARDTDIVADSLKEFVLIAQGGGKDVEAAFAKIHLNGKEMQKTFIKGGPEARKALDKVFDGLRQIKDPTERNATALALFGTKSEDAQKALLALDPSEAVDDLGKVGGAADEMGDALRDNASTKVEQFKRGLQQGVVDFLGQHVIPAVTGFKEYIGKTLGGLWDEAGKGNPETADRIVAFVGLLGQRLKAKMAELVPKMLEGMSAAGTKLAAYITANPEQALKLSAIALAIMAAVILLPALVAGAFVFAAGAMTVGFTKKLISGMQQKLPEWWAAVQGWLLAKAAEAPAALDAIGRAMAGWFGGLWSRYIAGPTSRQWAALMTSVNGLPGRARGALGALGSTLAGVASSAWQRFRDAASAKWSSFMGWAGGLPGRVRGALGGAMSSALYAPGQWLVRGLYNGVVSMGSWLRGVLIGWAKSAIPGPIAKALGIASPSRVMADAVGRWIPAGVVEGIEAETPAVEASMRSLVSVPTASEAMARDVGAVAAGGTRTGGAGAPRVVRLDAGDDFGRYVVAQLRKRVAALGGDVQFVLGT